MGSSDSRLPSPPPPAAGAMHPNSQATVQMAAQLAHEFNNCLTVIEGYAAMLLRDPPQDAAALRALEEIQRAGQKATRLTHLMQSFAGRRILRPQPVSPAEIVQTMLPWLRQQAGAFIRIALQLPAPSAGPHLIRCDPAGFEEAITLLATHALARMSKGGGELSLEVAPGPARPGPTVRLVLRDTGPAISTELKARLFEPFASDSPRGKGAGMTLAAVRGLIHQSGGEISVLASPQGLAMALDFPLHDCSLAVMADPAPLLPAPAPAHSSLGGLRVLLVEDDMPIRHLVAQMLILHDVQVLQAENGLDALQQIKASGADPIDLLLTDISLPGMDGIELYSRLSKDNAALRVIFMSGYTQESIEAETPLPAQSGYLIKPFSTQHLMDAIGTAMGFSS